MTSLLEKKIHIMCDKYIKYMLTNDPEIYNIILDIDKGIQYNELIDFEEWKREDFISFLVYGTPCKEGEIFTFINWHSSLPLYEQIYVNENFTNKQEYLNFQEKMISYHNSSIDIYKNYPDHLIIDYMKYFILTMEKNDLVTYIINLMDHVMLK